jgi:hypothetical protein
MFARETQHGGKFHTLVQILKGRKPPQPAIFRMTRKHSQRAAAVFAWLTIDSSKITTSLV